MDRPKATSFNHAPTRRTLLRGLGAAAGAFAISPALSRRIRAADYPPTDGEMQGFVLLKDRPKPPDVPFFDGSGNVRHFSDFGDRVLLVNFWATWCAPCIREMPSLAAIENEWGGESFKVLAISQDQQGKEVAEPFVRKRLGLDAPDLYYDPKSALGSAMGVDMLPTTFLLDREGGIVGAKAGFAHWDSDDAKRLIGHVLGEAGTAGTQDA